jgi:hypothetical protein
MKVVLLGLENEAASRRTQPSGLIGQLSMNSLAVKKLLGKLKESFDLRFNCYRSMTFSPVVLNLENQVKKIMKNYGINGRIVKNSNEDGILGLIAVATIEPVMEIEAIVNWDVFPFRMFERDVEMLCEANNIKYIRRTPRYVYILSSGRMRQNLRQYQKCT